MSLRKPLPAANVVLLLFGAGGHGRVVADAALLGGRWARIVASDRNPAVCHGELLPGIQLLDAQIAKSLEQVMHIAIGGNLAREREAGLWGDKRLVSIIHPLALVSQFSHISDGCFVAGGAVIGPGASIGIGSIVNHGSVVDHDVKVGAFSHIAPNATLGGDVKVGRRVLVGAGAVVLPSMAIADDVTVGAGAVVTTHLPEPGTYTGVPARKIQ
ncbi:MULTISPECIES: NeuD/PglB/VioB family sugar acetyltransferase [Polaromonas]|uniref:NeuD/PglB/VioB family sugar acetyltransferase n=1 Tax=Polaromonas aquatica TaxID=332657 RepID=A0ABW1U616_9BURK